MALRHLLVHVGLPLAFSCALAAAATAETAKAWTSWQAELHRDHVLVGRIWSADAGRFITPAQMAVALRQARYILLGEVHDNPDHHRLQAWAIRTLGAGKRRPAIVLEMFNDAQAPALTRFYEQSESCCRIVLPGALFKAVAWSKSGWPSATIYQPIVEAALSVHARLLPGSVTRAQVRVAARQGALQLPEARQKQLGLKQSLPAPLAHALRRELQESHCGLLPDRAFPAMMRVQRFRDAIMADRLAQAAGQEAEPKKSAILIAGNGHVRSDRGVPKVLRRIAPGKTIVVVTQAEVALGQTDPASYAPAAPDRHLATDYVWFTPRTKRSDPCEEMRRHMKSKTRK
jgi:uncharacterized iron-regulated protein